MLLPMLLPLLMLVPMLPMPIADADSRAADDRRCCWLMLMLTLLRDHELRDRELNDAGMMSIVWAVSKRGPLSMPMPMPMPCRCHADADADGGGAAAAHVCVFA